MDSDHFDALVRSFSEGTTRRSLTRFLGGLALSALLRPLASAAEKGGKGTGQGDEGTVPEDPTDDEEENDPDATVTPAATSDDGKPVTPETSGTEKGKDEKKEKKDTSGNDARTAGDGKPGTHDTDRNEKRKDGGNEQDTDGTKGGHSKDQGIKVVGIHGRLRKSPGSGRGAPGWSCDGRPGASWIVPPYVSTAAS